METFFANTDMDNERNGLKECVLSAEGRVRITANVLLTEHEKWNYKTKDT